MRVFVTGASGFVGRHLRARFGAEGAELVCPGEELDLRHGAAVHSAVAAARPDAVVHLAAVSSVPESVRAPDETYRVNFAGSRAVLEAVRREAPRARVLLVSSAAVYGPGSADALPFAETDALKPDSPYAWSKAAADLLGAVYADRGLDVVRVRPFNHTGPGRPDRFAESSFARQLAEMEAGRREPHLEVGNLEAVRDFLDVSDVVDAYWRLLDPSVPAGVYNVASGAGTSLRWILDALVTRTSVAPEVRVRPDRWRPTDRSVGSAARLQAATGWKPRVALEDSLGRLLDEWREAIATGR